MPSMRCYCVVQHGQPLQRIDLPMPVPQGTQVLVKVLAAGLCHTDLHMWEGSYDLGSGKRLSLAERGIHPPLTLSHEIAGEVVAAGPDAGAVPLDQTFLVHPWIGCGACAACLQGDENVCVKPRNMGIVLPGGMAEYTLVPHPRYLVDISGLEPRAAAPLACAGLTTYSALRKFGRRLHQGPIVIIGAGGLGLMALSVLQAMRGFGAVVVDIDPVKCEAARTAGALQTIDARSGDVVQRIHAATGGGALAVLDLVGTAATVSTAMAACARGGHIVICGLMGGEITLSLPIIPLRPLTLQGSFVGTLTELRELVALARVNGLMPIPLIERPLDEANEALRALEEGRVVGRTILLP